MGKSKQFKKFRRLAAQLPPLDTYGQKREIISGEDFEKQGVTEVQGEKVIPEKMYRKMTRVPVPMNHFKNLKRNYYRSGIAGVAHYCKAVTDHVANKLKPETDVPEQPGGAADALQQS